MRSQLHIRRELHTQVADILTLAMDRKSLHFKRFYAIGAWNLHSNPNASDLALRISSLNTHGADLYVTRSPEQVPPGMGDTGTPPGHWDTKTPRLTTAVSTDL
ncbi:hypothetical protein PoB_002638400 [Plakobranchus ocellatus]|uniref:Uncharacterized protein n=1 Tax=Plakobranchus ocellatus TaxID=259542 RepID=A0AAV4A111_9GAST|nr:hypothetical protein PoB_002638400 [Plakobranchus ocellatus]